MIDGYLIPEQGKTEEESRLRNKLTSVRVGKITSYLPKEKPSIIPFKGKFPLINPLSVDNYMDEFAKYTFFADVPGFLQNIVYNAEQIAYYDILFHEFLNEKKIGEGLFEKMDKNKKFELFDIFLDQQQAELSILNIKDYA